MTKLFTTAALGAALILTVSAQSPAPMQPAPMPAATAGAMTAATPPCTSKPVTVKLNTQNNSGEGGTAVLCDAAPAVVVVRLTVAGDPEGVVQPAHIHTGSCSNLGGIKYPLKSVTAGSSTTVVPAITVAQLENGVFAINVHESAADAKTYVACGNIPKAK